MAQIRALKPRRDDDPARFADRFARCDTGERLAADVHGQLSDLARKSVGPMALAAGLPPRTLQEFPARYEWDENGRRRRHPLMARDRACPHGIGLIDETSDTKEGVRTPGVPRPYGGAVGTPDSGGVAVHLGYAGGDFHPPPGGELFLPESGSDDRPRRREAGIPDAVVYRPETDVALELYDPAVAPGSASRGGRSTSGAAPRRRSRGRSTPAGGRARGKRVGMSRRGRGGGGRRRGRIAGGAAVAPAARRGWWRAVPRRWRSGTCGGAARRGGIRNGCGIGSGTARRADGVGGEVDPRLPRGRGRPAPEDLPPGRGAERAGPGRGDVLRE